jgi:hypothetical protein
VAERLYVTGDLAIDRVERGLHALVQLRDQPRDVRRSLVCAGRSTARIDRDRLGDANVRDARSIRRRHVIVHHITQAASQQTRADSLEALEDLLLAQARRAVDVATEASQSARLFHSREIVFESAREQRVVARGLA